ncbi:hypothetical protein [Streptomyces sp. NPDC029554]|uniref:hypothetical protein n=1 Tax=Streptomyces sp. NPDC029554 TaxID=3155126 RepID=UPI0033E9FC31
MMRSTPSQAAVAVLAAVAFATLISCSSDTQEGSRDEGRPGGTVSQAPSSASGPTPSPSPTGPCADGACEVEVAVGDVVTVPQRYGLGPIKVTAIADGEVRMTASLTGSGYSVSGCSGGGGVSSDGGGAVSLRCAEGPAATVNDAMSLTVVDVRDTTAALRIEPAG